MKKLITLAFVMSLAISSISVFAQESHNSDNSLCSERRNATSMDATAVVVEDEAGEEAGDQ